MKGYVYRIIGGGKTYYGSTTNMTQRIRKHRSKCNKTTAKEIFSICKDPVFDIVEEVEFQDRKELNKREGWWIENNVCVNEKVSGRDIKESHRISNHKRMDKIVEWNRNFRKTPEGKRRMKIYNERYKPRMKKYYEENKHIIQHKRKQKVVCECGCIVNRGSLYTHKKSNRHKLLMDGYNSLFSEDTERPVAHN